MLTKRKLGQQRLEVSAVEIARLDAALPPDPVSGPRYNERMTAFIDR